MRMRRLFVAVLAVAAIGMWSVPASAAPPKAGCPPSFTLMTFEQILRNWPPPDLQAALAQLEANDHNGDESLCVMLVADPVPGPGLLVVDNAAAT
jgi:hypothetical protein